MFWFCLTKDLQGIIKKAPITISPQLIIPLPIGSPMYPEILNFILPSTLLVKYTRGKPIEKIIRLPQKLRQSRVSITQMPSSLRVYGWHISLSLPLHLTVFPSLRELQTCDSSEQHFKVQTETKASELKVKYQISPWKSTHS